MLGTGSRGSSLGSRWYLGASGELSVETESSVEGRVSINWIGEECALLTKEVRQRDMSLYRPKPGPEHEYPETFQDTEIASANQKANQNTNQNSNQTGSRRGWNRPLRAAKRQATTCSGNRSTAAHEKTSRGMANHDTSSSLGCNQGRHGVVERSQACV